MRGESEKMKTLERIRREVLEMHNVYRAKHGADPLELDNKVGEFSQMWAEELVKTNTFKHSPRNIRPYGENLWGGGGQKADGTYSIWLGYCSLFVELLSICR